MPYEDIPSCLVCGRQFYTNTIAPVPRFCGKACADGYKDVGALQFKAGDKVSCFVSDAALTVLSVSEAGVVCTWTKYGFRHEHTYASADLQAVSPMVIDDNCYVMFLHPDVQRELMRRLVRPWVYPVPRRSAKARKRRAQGKIRVRAHGW